MDFELTEDQTALMSGLDGLLSRTAFSHGAIPKYHYYSETLSGELTKAGFLDVSRQEGFGPIDAALLVERVAQSPVCVETGATALIAPGLSEAPIAGPIALCYGLNHAPVRFLTAAASAIVLLDDDVLLIEVDPRNVEATQTVLGYPFGRWKALPGGTSLGAEKRQTVQRLWRVTIAAEAAGLMQAALDATVAYVKDRQQFGRPLGAFQAIQHRLAQCVQLITGTRLLALRAAGSEDEGDAALACLYAQDAMRTVVRDVHQFTGAMGLTLEYPLHLWTYRLKALQGELGGVRRQSLAVANDAWVN